jgi:hypothetical protein
MQWLGDFYPLLHAHSPLQLLFLCLPFHIARPVLSHLPFLLLPVPLFLLSCYTNCKRLKVGSMWFTFLPSFFLFSFHSSHVVIGCFVDPFSKFFSGLLCFTSTIFRSIDLSFFAALWFYFLIFLLVLLFFFNHWLDLFLWFYFLFVYLLLFISGFIPFSSFWLYW